MSHALNPLSTHCEKSLLGLEASGFCYTADAGGPSLGLFLDILLLPCVMEILTLWVCESGPFTCPSKSQTEWMLGASQVITLVLGPWSAYQFFPVLTTRLSSLVLPLLIRLLQQRVRGGASSPAFTLRIGPLTPTPLGPALVCCPGEEQGPLFRVLQLIRSAVSYAAGGKG